jgi:hypothetical protein
MVLEVSYFVLQRLDSLGLSWEIGGNWLRRRRFQLAKLALLWRSREPFRKFNALSQKRYLGVSP